jgi:hypothetical protein
MPDKKKKKRKKPPPTVNIARLYNEDIGFEGLKKKRLSGSNGISFQLPIDDQEESKRQKRMVSYQSVCSKATITILIVNN